MTQKELRGRITAVNADVRSFLEKGITAENQDAYNSKLTESRSLVSQLETLVEIDRVDEEQRAAQDKADAEVRKGRPALPQPGQANPDTRSAEQKEEEFRSALVTYMTTGDKSELRSQGSTVGSNGGFSIGTTLFSNVEKAAMTYGGILGALEPLNTANGEPINWPVSNNTNLASTVIAENAQVDETTLVIGSKQLNVSTFKTGVVRIPFQLSQDSVFDWDAFTRGELAEMYYRGLSNYITGINTDASFDPLVSSVSVGFTSAAAGAIGLADVAGLYAAVDPVYMKKFAMNRATQIYMSQQRNGLGTPIFPVNPQTGLLESLYGCPIVIDTTLPNIGAGNRAILAGDFTKYKLRRAPGIEIKTLVERYADFGQVGIMGYFRAGGRYLNAGTNPIQALKQAAS